MARALVTGNYAAGTTLARAGEANRNARGCAGGAYPITPQTEIIEYLRAFKFTRGRIVPVESEHSAMGVCIGASLAGARAFTASSANGLAYMTENVFTAGYYRLPIVMVAVNRSLGPPWNIWVDQGDSLALRDAPWIQLYAESHQDLVDTLLLAFRIAEDQRILLPTLVAMDGFITSHTQMVVDLPEQAQVDEFLPPLRLPHQLSFDHPMTVGGLTWPRETERQRRDIQTAMERVPEVYDEARREFARIFGRTPHSAMEPYKTSDANTVLVACNTMARTARRAVDQCRADGRKVGMVQAKMFRPFAGAALCEALGAAKHVGVLDRNHSPGSGGIFWQEAVAALRSKPKVVVQDYIVGLCGGDVTPEMLIEIMDDLESRDAACAPLWKEVAV